MAITFGEQHLFLTRYIVKGVHLPEWSMFALLFGLAMVARAVAAEPDWGMLPAELHPDTEALARASSRDDDEDDDEERRPRKKQTTRKSATRRPKVDWEVVDGRSLETYKIGWITGAVGAGVGFLGGFTGDPTLVLIGGLGERVGAPMMAGATLRSRRAILEQGVDVAPAMAYTSLGLSGLSLVGSLSAANTPGTVGERWFIIAIVSEIGAYTTAVLQHRRNEEGRFELDEGASTPGERPTLALTGFDVSPVEGGARLGLSGTF